MSGVERSHAALRRVATLVAHGVPPDELFAAVTREVVRSRRRRHRRHVPLRARRRADARRRVARADRPDAGRDADADVRGGQRRRMVLETGRPARIDDWSSASGEVATMVRRARRALVGRRPDHRGRALLGHGDRRPRGPERCPDGTEDAPRELHRARGHAIANSEARLELGRLVAEQSALRRVATLVAHDVAAGRDVRGRRRGGRRRLGADSTRVFRYEPDGTATVVGAGAGPATLLESARGSLEGDSVTARVLRTGRPRAWTASRPPGAFAADAAPRRRPLGRRRADRRRRPAVGRRDRGLGDARPVPGRHRDADRRVHRARRDRDRQRRRPGQAGRVARPHRRGVRRRAPAHRAQPARRRAAAARLARRSSCACSSGRRRPTLRASAIARRA